ncbi:metal ABC transporter substrate-binding protein [Flaviflexus equikiangi]|uniref:Zinc ABC transporter substrate-binding protein n=1 Tax=Flaviflexus equikiangi TaxID=2758573 RepID=A0ABS2TEU1_9ACTO|nr:metal ABC transporter substrate-binding protein [Flaviflexus equikiangi]MBM9433175.1 zinc ABC transporter substrate-binding protein [Flaviflexus equikiangi]
MKRRFATTAMISTAALVLAACSSDDAADADTISVTTSIYPLQYVAQMVGGDQVAVTSITPPGSDDHSLELSPRQVTDLEKVDLVVTLSGYQAAMDDAIATTNPARVVDAAEHASLLDWETHVHDEDEEAADHDHADDEHAEDTDHAEDEHAEDEHAHTDEAEDEAGHDHSGVDPHFWLDPVRLAGLAHPIAEELAEIDPENAGTYRSNADDLVAQLEDLDEDFSSGLNQCESTTFVVSHAAFGYLAHAYDLTQESIAGLEIDTEPSPKRVAEVSALVDSTGVDVIFATSESEQSLVRALAEETGVRVDILDAGATQVDESVDYDELMRTNLDKLQTALGCM